MGAELITTGDGIRASRETRAAALEALYRTRLDAFVRVAAAITGDRDSARDAVQEAFAGALRDVGRLRGEASLEAWVWTAVVNRARNQRRGRRRRGRHEDPASVAEDVSAPVAAAPDPVVRAMIARLPERQRLVMFLRYFADPDYATIASVAGIRVGTVSATLSAAHAAVRAEIEKEGAR